MRYSHYQFERKMIMTTL